MTVSPHKDRNTNTGAAKSTFVKAHDWITTNQRGVVGMATPLINVI